MSPSFASHFPHVSFCFFSCFSLGGACSCSSSPPFSGSVSSRASVGPRVSQGLRLASLVLIMPLVVPIARLSGSPWGLGLRRVFSAVSWCLSSCACRGPHVFPVLLWGLGLLVPCLFVPSWLLGLPSLFSLGFPGLVAVWCLPMGWAIQWFLLLWSLLCCFLFGSWLGDWSLSSTPLFGPRPSSSFLSWVCPCLWF